MRFHEHVQSDHGAHQAASTVPELSGRQRILSEALLEKSSLLRDIYVGAFMVLGDLRIPDRFPLAAHGFRELMDQFPSCTRVNAQARSGSLGDHFGKIEKAWNEAKKRSECLQSDGSWAGMIDKSVLRLLKAVGDACAWKEQNSLKRKEVIVKVFRELDGSGFLMPPPLEKLKAEKWQELLNYFLKVLHHNAQTTDDEFESWLVALEDMLIDQLRPRTYDEIAEIDQIIREGEVSDEG